MVADAQDKVKEYLVKCHLAGGEVMVACCDSRLLGMTLKDDELEVHVSERFYGGEKVSEEMMLKAISESTVANIMGDDAVEAALRCGAVDESGVREVCKVKHAQIYRV